MSGLGAWSFGFYHFNMDVPNDRVAAGIGAFKRALIHNGYDTGIVADLPIFGNYVRDRTMDFQAANGLAADGVIGPNTARVLFRKGAKEQQDLVGIPDDLLLHLKSLESNNDPVAEGYVDPDDEGLVQIHLPYYPSITQAMAWDPGFCLHWAANDLAGLKGYTGSWKGAVAGYNTGGYYARLWVQNGYPATGGPVIGKDGSGNPIYVFTRATNYWKDVTASAI